MVSSKGFMNQENGVVSGTVLSDSALIRLGLLCKENKALMQALMDLELTSAPQANKQQPHGITNHELLKLLSGAFINPNGIFRLLVGFLNNLQNLINNIINEQNKLKELISTDRKNVAILSKLPVENDSDTSSMGDKSHLDNFFSQDIGALNVAYVKFKELYEEARRLVAIFDQAALEATSKLDGVITSCVTSEDFAAFKGALSELKEGQFLTTLKALKSYSSILKEADELKERYQEDTDITSLEGTLLIGIKYALSEQLDATLSKEQQKIKLDQAAPQISKLAKNLSAKLNEFNSQWPKQFKTLAEELKQKYNALNNKVYQQGVLSEASNKARLETDGAVNELVNRHSETAQQLDT